MGGTVVGVLVVLLVVVAVFAVACGDASPTAEPRPAQGDVVYEATTTVLESEDHGPELCLGGIATSMPPLCGGTPVTNWDWDAVEGEARELGTTWGTYFVAGQYDGERFTLVETPGPPRREPAPDQSGRFAPACADPEEPVGAGGDEGSMGRISAYGAEQADFAGLWLSPNGVVNVAFTGDLDRHRRELREVSSQPFCVVEFERTEAELTALGDRLRREASEIGIRFLSSGVDIVRNRLEVEAVLVTDEHRAEIDRRYGEGTVVATSALRLRR